VYRWANRGDGLLLSMQSETAAFRPKRYSDSPAALRASALSVKLSTRTLRPSRKVRMVGSSYMEGASIRSTVPFTSRRQKPASSALPSG